MNIIGDKYTLCKPFKESIKGFIINNPEHKIEEKVSNLVKSLNKNKQYIVRSNSPNKIESKNFGIFESHIVYPDIEEIKNILKKESKKIRENRCLPQFLIQEYIHFDYSGVARNHYAFKNNLFHIEWGDKDEVTSGKKHEKYIYSKKHKPIKILKKVDSLLRKVEKKYDNKDIIIEWGIKKNKIYLLQVRIVEEKSKNPVDKYIKDSTKATKKVSSRKAIMFDRRNYPALLDLELIKYASNNSLFQQGKDVLRTKEIIPFITEDKILSLFIEAEEKTKLKGKSLFIPSYLKKEIDNLKNIYGIRQAINFRKNNKYLIDELYNYSTTIYFMRDNELSEEKQEILTPTNNSYSITTTRYSEHEWPEHTLKRKIYNNLEYKNILEDKVKTINEELNYLEISSIAKIRKILKKQPYPVSYRASLSLTVEEILSDNIPKEKILLNREKVIRKLFNPEEHKEKYYIYGDINGKIINIDDIKDKTIPLILNDNVIIVGTKIPVNIISDFRYVDGIITTEDTGELSHLILNAKEYNIPVLIKKRLDSFKTGNIINIKY